jgi:transcriptional regulator with XRE-family HTH domain
MTRLEQLRLDAGMSYNDLAASTKVSPRTIRNIESGVTVSVKSLARLSTHFGIPASQLLLPAYAVVPLNAEPNEQAA